MTPGSVFFAQALLVIGLPYTVWRLLRVRAILPLVVVQIATGILLGPSFLGLWLPGIWERLFQPQHLQALSGLQWLAISLFAFLTGAHAHTDACGRARQMALWVTAGGMLLPFIAGTAGGLWLAQNTQVVGENQANTWWFALAVGISMAVTALPVLAALLREMRLTESPLGRMAISCAAMTDGLTWIFIAVMVLFFNGGDSFASIVWLLAASATYLLVCLVVVRPLLRRWLDAHAAEHELQLVAALLIALACALVADLVGLHHVVGGFIAGMLWPRQHAQPIAQQLDSVTSIALLPFFFLATGIKLSLGAMDSDTLTVIALCAPIAILAKIIGTALPARMNGLAWRDALALGSLMQTKGLVEVVVLSIFLDAGIIGQTAFSGLLIVALGTTVLAKPLTEIVLGSARKFASATKLHHKSP